jgi:hypothetical protein
MGCECLFVEKFHSLKAVVKLTFDILDFALRHLWQNLWGEASEIVFECLQEFDGVFYYSRHDMSWQNFHNYFTKP